MTELETDVLWHHPASGVCLRVVQKDDVDISSFLRFSNLLPLSDDPIATQPRMVTEIEVAWVGEGEALSDVPTQQHVDGRLVITGKDGIAVFLDESRIQVALSRQFSAEPQVLLIVLFYVISVQGALRVHALAIEFAGRKILAIGKSSAGKSTLAAAALSAGGKLVSDDSVVLYPQAGSYEAASMRTYMRFRSPSDCLLPLNLRTRLQAANEPTAWFLGVDELGDQYLEHFCPDTLFILNKPDNRPKGSVVAPVSQAEAYALWVCNSVPWFYHHASVLHNKLTTEIVQALLIDLSVCKVTVGSRLLDDPAGELGSIVQQCDAM